MASIFKRKKKKNQPYWIQYTDHEGKRKTQKGFTDKALTEQLASKLETEAMLRKTGIVDVEQENLAEKKRTPLIGLLGDFEESLADNSEKHVKLTMTRVRKIVIGSGFEKLADINEESVQKFLRRHCRENDIGHRTYNHYVQAIDSFCNWCVSTKRLASNPLIGLERRNTETDVRHQRRALKPSELEALVLTARNSNKSIQCYNGETRARIYILSYMTGLRRGELASLTPRSFQLDTSPPTLTVEAKNSKHRKKDVLPIHNDLAKQVKVWFSSMKPTQKIFPKLAQRKTWLMVKKDLETAGIRYETEEGIADFHAAGRHTHITELLRNGVTLPEAQKLARHSDINQTMKYTHIGIEDQARAVAQLPSKGLDIEESVDGTVKDVSDDALQMRCISGVFDQHSVSSDGTDTYPGNDETPVENRGFDSSCHLMAECDNMEAAGIEPASCES